MNLSRIVRRAILLPSVVLAAMLFCACRSRAAEPESSPASGTLSPASGTLNVLFIGNSFTGRHDLSQLVKRMAEAGNPDLKFEVTKVLYGGRRLVDHWRLGSQNIVNIAALTAEDERDTIKSLKQMLVADPQDDYATRAIARHEAVLESLAAPRKKWDIVVLQSSHDDLEGDASLYAEYAPRFAEIVHKQGGRVILYETTPETQNAHPLTSAPDAQPIREKAAAIARLAKKVDARVVPMSSVAQHCQTVRPDLTLRFVNDAHLNHTMAYLTACAFYSVLFGRSPVGLPVDTVTDTRSQDAEHKDLDRDGHPIEHKFSAKERADLQQIAWDGVNEYRQLAESANRDN